MNAPEDRPCCAGSFAFSHSARIIAAMHAPVQLTVPMPAKLAELRFPKALDQRLQFLLMNRTAAVLQSQ